jgi:hypothetical protein
VHAAFRPRLTQLISILALAASLAVPGAQARPADAGGVDCHADSMLAESAWHAQACRADRQALASARGPAALPPTPWAFAHDVGATSNNVVRHRIVDFPRQTILGQNTKQLFGYDFDGQARTLYALDNVGQQLGRMTLTNGAFTAIGPSVPLAGHTWSGLTFHPRTNKLYASSTNSTTSALYTVDPATGAATLVDTQTTTPILIDISINCAGVMVGHDIGTDSLYRINKTTAAATLVGATGVAANFAQGMDFDNRTGKLYVYAYIGGGANQYGTANLRTGALTPLATNNPLGEFEGATQTRCPGPNTTITKKPPRTTARHRAVFEFKASFAPSTFRCRLDDKPYTNCSSPFVRVVGAGGHRLLVRAKDPVGNTDGTPARYRWTVRR